MASTIAFAPDTRLYWVTQKKVQSTDYDPVTGEFFLIGIHSGFLIYWIIIAWVKFTALQMSVGHNLKKSCNFGELTSLLLVGF